MPRICAGCGQSFASNEAFEMHATGHTHPLAGAPRRCRDTAEMHSIGMSKAGPAYAWTATNRDPRRKRPR